LEIAFALQFLCAFFALGALGELLRGLRRGHAQFGRFFGGTHARITRSPGCLRESSKAPRRRRLRRVRACPTISRVRRKYSAGRECGRLRGWLSRAWPRSAAEGRWRRPCERYALQ